jgi:hypothetical protein
MVALEHNLGLAAPKAYRRSGTVKRMEGKQAGSIRKHFARNGLANSATEGQAIGHEKTDPFALVTAEVVPLHDGITL